MGDWKEDIARSFKCFLPGVCLSLVICTGDALAQDHSAKNPVSLIGGAGNYEYLYSGFNFGFSGNHYFEIAIGIKPWDFKSETYAMVYGNMGFPLFNDQKNPLLKLYLQPKVIVWYLNNEFNKFLFMGVGPEARLVYSINTRLQLCGSGGVIYNAKLYYERKTNEEVGWPREYQPSFSLQLSYWLK